MELLKSGTEEQHRLIERHLDLVKPSLTLGDYRRLLERFYGFYVPVETLIRRNLTRYKVVFNYEFRLKVPLLEQDLQKLDGANFQFQTLPLCHETPVLKSLPQTIGCLYVLEGATLGGQLISRQLREHLSLTAENGAAFFSGYGAQTGAMWKEFGAFAAMQAEMLRSDDEIVAAAVETFKKFSDWLSDGSVL